ncbi:MAG: CopG family antitoxin [Pseudomonadota bacterium]
MSKRKSSMSKAESYKEAGDFWDSHDLSDFWGKTKKADFEVDIKSEITLCAIDKKLSEQMLSHARKRGVSVSTLLNLWLQEKLQEQKT